MVADTVCKCIFRIQKTTCNYSGNDRNRSAEPIALSFHEKEAKQISYISYTGDLLLAYTHSSGSKLVGN